MASAYFNATSKYLHLGDKETGQFDFNIKKSAQEKGSSYTWYVKADKGNPASVSINKKTGLVTAKAAGVAYIRCKITLSDGTLELEAKISPENVEPKKVNSKVETVTGSAISVIIQLMVKSSKAKSEVFI